MIFFGTARDLQFIPDNKLGWLKYLEGKDGKKLVIQIDVEKSKRSLDQNAYYWAYISIIANETGNDQETLHRLFKGMFLNKKPFLWKGKTYMMSGSTTELGKAEFGEYLDRIASESGVPLPDPTLLGYK